MFIVHIVWQPQTELSEALV